MPKLFFTFLFTLCTSLIFAPPLRAATDPLSATVSASARVPSTAPTTSDTLAPPPVILVSPFDGATTKATRPEFVWIQTFDSNSNTVTYTVKLNGVATYLGISNTGNSQQFNYLAHLGDGRVYLTPTLDLAEGTYDWSVTASDAAGNTSHSTTWRFVIDTTAPALSLTNVDDRYHNPPLVEGTIFELAGPQDVTLVFATEPWATVSLTFKTPDSTLISYPLPTNQTGIATLTLALPLGATQVTASSFDSAGHTTTLPSFVLNLTSSPYAGLFPALTLPRPTSRPHIPSQLQFLPAAISQIQDTQQLAILPYLMLAVAISLLLIIIWKRRRNILILDATTNQPLRSLIVYHSRPNRSARFALLPARLYVTNTPPVLYTLPRGQAYISRLGRYSSLTIRTPEGATHILSLSLQRKKYIIAL